MGFGNEESKGHYNELAAFDQLINEASREQLEMLIADLQEGSRLMPALIGIGANATLAYGIDRTWFGAGANDVMFSVASELSPGQMHAIMCQLAVELAQRRIDDEHCKIDMWAGCKENDAEAKRMRVTISRPSKGNEWIVKIFGPYNMCEGGPNAADINEIRKQIPSVDSLSLEETEEWIEKVEGAGQRGALGYLGTDLALKIKNPEDRNPAAAPRAATLGNVLITWLGESLVIREAGAE